MRGEGRKVDRRGVAFTCERYRALPGERRCQHYIDGGSCRLPSEFMCVEWMRRNGASNRRQGEAPQAPAHPIAAEETQPPSERGQLDFAGRVAPPDEPRRARTAAAAAQRGAVAPSAPPAPRVSARRALDGPGLPPSAAALLGAFTGEHGLDESTLEALSDDALDALTDAGFELTLDTFELGAVVLVGEFTDSERTELRFRDARTLLRVASVFPKATVVDLRRPKGNKQEPKEAP